MVLEPLPTGERDHPRRQTLGRQGVGGLAADDDLSGPGDRLHARERRHGAARDDQLSAASANEQKLELAAVHANRHPQPDRPAARLQPAFTADHRLHLDCGAAGTADVLVALEQQEDRVSPPLDHSRPVIVSGGDQVPEQGVDQPRHLLGPDLPDGREHLRHPRESGDVGEHQRAVERAVPGFRLVAQPVGYERGHEGTQWCVLSMEAAPRNHCAPGHALSLLDGGITFHGTGPDLAVRNPRCAPRRGRARRRTTRWPQP